MSIRRRVEHLEGAIAPRPRMHLVNPTEWSEEERCRYLGATEEEREAIVRDHAPGLRDGDLVVIWSIPRPGDRVREP